MVRQYGGYISNNDDVIPNGSEANGAWIGPSELYRQTAFNEWPEPPLAGTAASVPVGSIVYAMNSNAVVMASGTDEWIIPDNQLLRTAVYVELNEVIGQTYGGDNGIFFAAPSGNTDYYYYRGQNAAVSGLANYIVDATIPDHTHVYQSGRGGQNPTGGMAAGGNQVGDQNITRSTANKGDTYNRARSKKAFPIVAARGQANMAAGAVFPWMLPVEEAQIGQYLNLGPTPTTPYYFVCSGQDVSRVDNSDLYTAIGTLYGAGDGSTTFTLPDLRGLFIENHKYLDGGQLSGGNNYTSSAQGAHYHNCSTITNRNSDSGGGGGSVSQNWGNPPTQAGGAGDQTENRPTNLTVVWLIQGG